MISPWLTLLQVVSQVPVVAQATPPTDPVSMEITKIILASCGSAFVTYFFHRATQRDAERRDRLTEMEKHREEHRDDWERHRKEHEELRDDLASHQATQQLHAAFIEPLRTIFQEHLVTALLKTNPFTPIENEAAQRIMSLGFPYADTQDLYIVQGACHRIIREVESRSGSGDMATVPKDEKEMDQMIYASILAGIGYELERRRVEVKQSEIAERRRARHEEASTADE